MKLTITKIRAAVRQIRAGTFAPHEYPKVDAGFRRRAHAPPCVR